MVFKRVVFPVPLAPNKKQLLDFDIFNILLNILNKYTLNIEYSQHVCQKHKWKLGMTPMADTLPAFRHPRSGKLKAVFFPLILVNYASSI